MAFVFADCQNHCWLKNVRWPDIPPGCEKFTLGIYFDLRWRGNMCVDFMKLKQDFKYKF